MVSFVARKLGFLCGVAAMLSFCAACGGKTVPPPPAPAAAPAPETAPKPPASVPTAEKKADAGGLQPSLNAALSESSRLRQALAERSAEVTALEEAKATLELELKSALEELVRSQTSIRNVQSRAFAVSRIAEVRVELQSWKKRPDPALADRLQRASVFLDHADRALAEDNMGGAAYLAERASELLRQVRTIAEIRGSSPTELIPLVPARKLLVLAAANLRRDPSSDSEKLGAVEPGTELKAIARRGEWFQVEVAGMAPAWVYRRLVR